MQNYDDVIVEWKKSWEVALLKWTKFTRLREPYFITTHEERKNFSTGNLFAMIRLTDQPIFVDIPKVIELKLIDYPLEIFCHEIGHHIAYPSNITDMGRMLLRIKKALTFPSLTYYTNFVGNVYTDLLINHKLKTEFELKIDEVYKRIKPPKADEFWNFYMRIYELLWALPKNTLTIGEIPPTMEADAMLGNRLIRNYSIDWIRGAGKFASLCIPYLMDSKSNITQRTLSVWLDNSRVNDKNCKEIPQSLFDYEEIDDSEIQHPSMDSELSETNSNESTQEKLNKQSSSSSTSSPMRSPNEITEILNQLGISFNFKDFTRNYYKQLALPHLIPFPKRVTSQTTEQILEGTEIWELGSPFEKINWFQTAMKSPIVIPGYTILEDYYGEDKGTETSYETIDLDVYVDSSA
ncbi:MAG: hypothetical protein N3A69_04325, partial [Leptospiraceae bacterium]|nr:hypothetical protein [Leptospiraceae bacterium]